MKEFQSVLNGIMKYVPKSEGIHGPDDKKNMHRWVHGEAKRVLIHMLWVMDTTEMVVYVKHFLRENASDV